MALTRTQRNVSLLNGGSSIADQDVELSTRWKHAGRTKNCLAACYRARMHLIPVVRKKPLPFLILFG